MKTSVHNVNTERMLPGDVYIGRRRDAGYSFGNPFVMRHENERMLVVDQFEHWARRRIRIDRVYRERVKALHGKRLFCFCAPLPCHGDVLAVLARELTEADGEEPFAKTCPRCSVTVTERDWDEYQACPEHA